jgi:hypothetical protein
MAEPATVPAYRHPNGSQAFCWCAHCRCYHWHGLPLGHRCAHCHEPDSPYGGIGYVLIDAGPASPEVLRDARRKHPHGPNQGGSHAAR